MSKAVKAVRDFLQFHWKPGKPLLIGFSGGSDSMALLHALLEIGQMELIVCHVDHGWRKESEKEASELKNYIEGLGLQFFMTRLEGLSHTEEAARNGRLSFFKTVYQEHKCQAVVLAHHGDDQSETILKRILEGGILTGIRPVTVMEEMQVWRPFLQLRKSDLREWLDEKKISYTEDTTNLDSRYLRGKMRTTIIPHLENQFGKRVSENLCRLGNFAEELESYFEQKIKKFEIYEEGDFFVVNFSKVSLEPLEVKIFLKQWARKNKIFLSHTALQNLYKLLEKGISGKVGSKGRWMEVRGRSVAIKKV